MAEEVSAEDILDADSEDFEAEIMDTEVMASVPGEGGTTQGEVLAGWVAVTMAMEGASLPAIILDSGMEGGRVVPDWANGIVGITEEDVGTGTTEVISTKSNSIQFDPELT